jgi:hypothetical protein
MFIRGEGSLDEWFCVFLVRLQLRYPSVPSCESSDLGVYLFDRPFPTAGTSKASPRPHPIEPYMKKAHGLTISGLSAGSDSGQSRGRSSSSW